MGFKKVTQQTYRVSHKLPDTPRQIFLREPILLKLGTCIRGT